MKHGNGVYTYMDGNKYDGNWEEDVRHGKGILYFVSGDKYEGDFYKGHMQGKGICFLGKSGDRYEGEWHNDKKMAMAHTLQPTMAIGILEDNSYR